MFYFILKRILQGIPVLFIVATLTFFMVRLAPGGPFSIDKNVSPEIIRNINKHYGLDKPLYQQYADYMLNLLKGDLGPSYKYASRTVNDIISETFPVSLQLGLMAMFFALVAGVIGGIIAASAPNTYKDYLSMAFSMVGICVPAFVLGPVLIWLFSIKLGWFNATGWNSWGDCVLPVITLGALYAANIARLSRTGILEVLSQDFVRTAKAKGLNARKVIVKHVLRGGLLSVVSYFAPAVAGVITGSFVVETIFQIPGLGKIFVESAFDRDYTVIIGTVLFFALLIVILNIVADIVLVWMDPRRKFTD